MANVTVPEIRWATIIVPTRPLRSAVGGGERPVAGSRPAEPNAQSAAPNSGPADTGSESLSRLRASASATPATAP